MADQWFYTSNGKQMEPVPIAKLRKLAASGFVKPTDLVWQDGMPNWIRANAAKGLFDDGGASSPGPMPGGQEDRASSSDRHVPDDGGRRRPRRGADYFDQDPDRPNRRPTRDGLSAGAKIAIILSVVLVVGGSVVGGIILLVNSSNNAQRNNFVGIKDKGGAKVGNLPVEYTTTVRPDNTDARNLAFKGNTRYEFQITTDFNGDLDCFVRDQNNWNQLDQWVVNQTNRHEWVAPYAGTFRVELIQLGNGATKTTVKIREIGPGWGNNNGKFAPPNFLDKGVAVKLPPPAPAIGVALNVGVAGITKTGTINQFAALDPGGQDRSPCHVYLVRLEQGFTYQIDLQSRDFDAFLRIEDSNFVQLAEHDDIDPGINQDARIQFNCDRSDNYRIVCRPLLNRFGLGNGRYTLKVKKI